MDYFAAFEISASGMDVQKARLDNVALNLANVNTTRTAAGGPYRAREVVIGERSAQSFQTMLTGFEQNMAGAQVVDIAETNSQPRLVYSPQHPDAGEDGFVAYPDINPVSEMVTMMEATRAYEANVKAVNAAKTMALKALEIGGR